MLGQYAILMLVGLISNDSLLQERYFSKRISEFESHHFYLNHDSLVWLKSIAENWKSPPRQGGQWSLKNGIVSITSTKGVVHEYVPVKIRSLIYLIHRTSVPLDSVASGIKACIEGYEFISMFDSMKTDIRIYRRVEYRIAIEACIRGNDILVETPQEFRGNWNLPAIKKRSRRK